MILDTVRRPALVGLIVGTLSLAPATVSAADPVESVDVWTVTGAPVQATGYSTATTLPDGRVLAVGGQGRIAELYQPSSGTWSAAADMNRSRTPATATLLPSGQVLVVGGFDGTTVQASAELFDPASGRWTVTGSLNVGRYDHTATLVANGKVLVAGGKNETYAQCGYYTCSPIASAELYDPATGQWSPTGAMTTSRSLFTATLLADGTVLAAAYGPADLYDPATGVWSRTTSLPSGITSYAAVRLFDGRVMSIGGSRFGGTAATLYNPGHPQLAGCGEPERRQVHGAVRGDPPERRTGDGRRRHPERQVRRVVGSGRRLLERDQSDVQRPIESPRRGRARGRAGVGRGQCGPGDVVRQLRRLLYGPFHPAEVYTP